MDEAIILETDKVFRWEGPKRKQTLVHAKLGRLVLTDRRLLFLSTGKNDINLRRIGGGAVTPLAALVTGKTAHLDLEAVHAEGGLEIPVEHLVSAELTSMFKVLTISWDTGDGPVYSTFAPKNGGMPDGPRWVEALRRAIDGDDTHRPPAAAAAGPFAAPVAAHAPSGRVDPEPAPRMDVDPPPPPTRPGRAVAGFRNPDRLAATVEDLTRRFGVEILDHPSRVRNLLRDDYGADATRDRSDIDTFVSVLEHRPLSALDEGRTQQEVAGDLSRVTSLDEPGALWTLSVLQRARPGSPAGTDATVVDRVAEPPARHGGPRPSATLLEPTATHSSSRHSRTGVLVAIVAVLGLLATLGAWFAGRSSADDWRERALAAEKQVEAIDLRRVSGSEGDTTNEDAVAGDDTAATEDTIAVAETVATDADLEELRAAYDEAAAQVATLAEQREQLVAQVEAAQATVARLQAELDGANAEVAARGEPFLTTPNHPVGAITGVGDLTRCDGFGEPCAATYYLGGRLIESGGQRLFEVPDMVLVTLTSPDGVSWNGSAEIIGQYGAFTCSGQRITTTFAINLHPADYRVDPVARTIDVVSYDVDFTLFSQGTGCTDATSAYRGRFELS